MKTLTITPSVAQHAPARTSHLAPQIKAAALKAVRTVFNPWTISGIGVVTTASGIIFWHETIYLVGAVIAVVGITIALTKEFLQEMKGGAK